MSRFDTYDQSVGGFAQLIEMFQIVTAGRATLLTASPDEIRLQLDGIRYTVSGTGLTVEVINGQPFITGGQITSLRAVNPALGDSMELTEVAISVPDMVASVGRDGEITSVLDYLAFEIGPYVYIGSDLQDDGLIMAQRGGLGGDDFFLLGGGDDRMNGGGGNDQMYGGKGRDSVEGGAGNDTLFGGAGSDTLYGGTGDDQVYDYGLRQDLLYGGVGNDSMVSSASHTTLFGGSGNDSLGGGSQGTVFGDAGNDTLYASFSYRTRLFGGEGDDRLLSRDNDEEAVLSGDSGRDTLSGAARPDRLFGGADGDRLLGGADRDTLHGGAGDDTMDGGTSNDIYVVNSRRDVVIEQTGNGTDIVRALVSHSLTGHVEILQLRGAAAINGIGNGLDNRLVGNVAANVLIGREGNDTLTGGAGADSFVFDRLPDAANADVILDFAAGEDEIVLRGAVFGGLPPGALAADRFHLGAVAGDADDRLLYDAGRGQLWFDADGTGAGARVRIAGFGNGAILSAEDILIG